MRNARVLLLLVLIVSAPYTSIKAAKLTIYLDNASVVTHTRLDSGASYYTLQFQVPIQLQGKELYGAFLEFYLDVVGEARDSASVRIPVLDIYSLSGAYGGQIDPSKFDRATGTVRNIPPGDNQRVLVDITEIVRNYIEDASTNYGLIIGGLEDMRDGSFTWKPNSFPSAGPARIIFHYDNRMKDD